jgi:hypothetical protein
LGGLLGGWLTGGGVLPTKDGLLAGGKQLLGGVGNLAAGTAMGAALMGETEVALFATALAVATGALGPFGVAVVGATVAYNQYTETNKRREQDYVDFSQQIVSSIAETERWQASTAASVEEMDRMQSLVVDTRDTFGMINLAGDNFQTALTNVATNVNEFAAEVLSHTAVMHNASVDMQQRFQKEAEQEQLGYAADLNHTMAAWLIDDQFRKDHGEKTRAERLEAEKAKKKVEGKGGMTVHNVWITVSSNQAPGQIAREVVNELGRRNRYRTTPRNTVNFSAGRGSGF